jgi:peptide/nickel transport system ATP-binding protein
MNGKRILLKEDIPSPIDLPRGCRFHTRCPYAFDRCRAEEPALREIAAGHFAACHLNEGRMGVSQRGTIETAPT